MRFGFGLMGAMLALVSMMSAAGHAYPMSTGKYQSALNSAPGEYDQQTGWYYGYAYDWETSKDMKSKDLDWVMDDIEDMQGQWETINNQTVPSNLDYSATFTTNLSRWQACVAREANARYIVEGLDAEYEGLVSALQDLVSEANNTDVTSPRAASLQEELDEALEDLEDWQAAFEDAVADYKNATTKYQNGQYWTSFGSPSALMGGLVEEAVALQNDLITALNN